MSDCFSKRLTNFNKYLSKINKYLSKIKSIRIKYKTSGEEEKEKKSDRVKQSTFSKKELTELDSAGFALSRRFRLSLLRKASKLQRKDAGEIGQEVHGWMQVIFGNRYNWLITNDVFDRAISYALEYYNPEVFSVVKNYDFENAIINVMILPEKTHYDEFEEFEYDKVIILTQGKTFEESVLWKDNSERTEDGYKIMKTVADCNFLNLGLTLWDKPVVVLKDAVGMDKLFFKAKTDANQMENIKDQLLKMHIYTKRQEELTTNEKMLEKDIKYNQLKEEHQFYLDSIKAGDHRNPEEKLREFAEKYEADAYKKHTNWKRIGLITTTLVIVIGVMFLISRLTGG